MKLHNKINKPTTKRGKRFLEKRAPQLHEYDKETLVIKGRKTSQTVLTFLNDLSSVKKPFVTKLKFKNNVLPFEDVSFIERMCSKNDCALFMFGMHSKKRPDNIVMGRLFDGEILDMFEFGIKNYKPLGNGKNIDVALGSKPMLLFSGEGFNEDSDLSTLKSFLIDMFRGPKVDKIRSSGIEYQIHFAMSSPNVLSVRSRVIKLEKSSGNSELPPLHTPWGSKVDVHLEDCQPSFDLVLRRKKVPSSEKWRDSMRIPAQLAKQNRVAKENKAKHRVVDEFGSRVGQVHVARETAVDELRPSASLRTALTGNRKTGNERVDKVVPGQKRKRTAGNTLSEQARDAIDDDGADASAIFMETGDPLAPDDIGPQMAKMAKRLRAN